MMRSREKERKGYNNIRNDIIHIIDQKRKPADRTDRQQREGQEKLPLSTREFNSCFYCVDIILLYRRYNNLLYSIYIRQTITECNQ